MSKPKGANSKMVLIRQFHLCLWSHKIFQIGKIFFNFPGAPFMAGAKRSQFGQFAQRVPSNSPQTDVFFPLFPLSRADFLFSLFACFLSNFECKSQKKVVKLRKLDFPHKFGRKCGTCWFNFHFARHLLNMRLVLNFDFTSMNKTKNFSESLLIFCNQFNSNCGGWLKKRINKDKSGFIHIYISKGPLYAT